MNVAHVSTLCNIMKVFNIYILHSRLWICEIHFYVLIIMQN